MAAKTMAFEFAEDAHTFAADHDGATVEPVGVAFVVKWDDEYVPTVEDEGQGTSTESADNA